jgi:AcrR family transcriptional regulator
MQFSEQVAERSVAEARARATAEVTAFMDAGLAVLARDGAGFTVASVLRAAGMSTRAFYRHFQSKDELVVAIYERDAEATLQRLAKRVGEAPDPRAAVETWVDETLALVYDHRRARRTSPLAIESARLQTVFPEVFARMLERQLEPLVDALERGRADGTFPTAEPAPDARSIHAVAWALAQQRMAGSARSRSAARDHVLRFCLPALGAVGSLQSRRDGSAEPASDPVGNPEGRAPRFLGEREQR